MHRLKKLDHTFTLYGSKFGIKLCCMIWFQCVWNTLRADEDYYNSYEHKSFYEKGEILCPECLITEVSQTIRSKGN